MNCRTIEYVLIKLFSLSLHIADSFAPIILICNFFLLNLQAISRRHFLMLFNSTTYLIFLPLVFACYWLMRSKRGQNMMLLLGSMVFYGWWSLPYLGMMTGTCLLNYLISRQLEGSAHRKSWLVGSLLLNFGVLGLFKYFNFFAENLSVVLNALGLRADIPTLALVLPVGISFYTFQLSAYMVDCYRGTLRATHSLLDFLSFIMFFPQLVAGPIERGSQLLRQIEQRRRFKYEEGVAGLRLILLGLFKKMVIADNCSVPVDAIFSNPDGYNAPVLLFGAVLFTLQIYGDFSGYCDIAKGSAHLMGIRLSVNFDRPYFSTSMMEFWRRWHVTLQSWFRDYVYIPLGGSHVGFWRTQLNIFIVFFLSGLWHGASWTFVLWGCYHAVLYIPSRLLARNRKSKGFEPHGFILELCRLRTFMLFCLGQIIFRCQTIGDVGVYFSSMFDLKTFSHLSLPPSATLAAVGLLSSLLLLACERMTLRMDYTTNGFDRMPRMVRRCLYVVIVLMILAFGGDNSAFIYFQF